MSEQEPRLRYRYQFKLDAKGPMAFTDEESKAEVQSYINDLLGLKDQASSRERDS